MIPHSILLSRLQTSFGITGSALSFITSYLSNRSQRVRVGQSLSDSTVCDTGVPQGSVLGPLLFSLYVSPIGQIASHSNISLQQYADDTQLYFSTSAAELQSNLTHFEQCLETLHSWFCHNGLVLNSDKSDAIIFGTRQRLRNFQPPANINIANSIVPLSDKLTTLGVTLDTHLTFSPHISTVCKSAFYHIRAFRQIRAALTDDMAKAVGTSLVQSRLDYANSVLYGVAASHLNKLQHVQNTLARVVLRSNYSRPPAQLLSELHWLPIESRIKFKLATITYKTLSTSQPQYLRSSLQAHIPTRNTRFADQQPLAKPYCSTEFGRRAFSYAAPLVWNAIPLEIRLSPSVSSFKRHLKTLFCQNNTPA